MIVASSDKEWLQWPIEILVLETVLSHLKGDIIKHNNDISMKLKWYYDQKIILIQPRTHALHS